MRRGEIWTAAGGPDYVGKPGPVVIVQGDAFSETASITVCLLTTVERDAPLIRIRLEPNEPTNLRQTSWVMVDKITTVRRDEIGSKVGRVDDGGMTRIGQALMVFLGLAGPSS